jgi:hypothetical protein
MSKRHTLTLELIETSDGYRATEKTAEPVGEGDTAHDAVIDHVERARSESKRKVIADGGEDA